MKKINLLVTTVGGMTSPDILKAFRNTKDYLITGDTLDFNGKSGSRYIN